MKKILTTLLCLCLILSMVCLYAYGEDLADGTYEVNVTLMHKKDEKESTGNKYIAQKALLKVSGDEKTITLLLDTDMSGIAFSYYLDGSIEGDAAEGTPVTNVSVDGKTYDKGFEIPIVKDGDIGLKFSVPVMPMSPSARLRIDYSSAVLVQGDETANTENTTTTPAVPKEDTTTAEVTPEVTSEATIENTTTTQHSTAATVTTTSPTTSAVVPANKEVQQESKMTPVQLMMVLSFILAACVLSILAVSKREDEMQ